MAKNPFQKSTDGAGQPHTAKNGDGTRAATVDRWLEEKLRSAYGSVLDEPIPEDLLRLIHQKLKD